MRRFWVSWLQPTKDYRPLRFPPNERILGWWYEGRDLKDIPILNAIVEGEDLEAAKTNILADWPEAGEWRFSGQIRPDGRPANARLFPVTGWMVPRIERTTR